MANPSVWKMENGNLIFGKNKLNIYKNTNYYLIIIWQKFNATIVKK